MSLRQIYSPPGPIAERMGFDSMGLYLNPGITADQLGGFGQVVTLFEFLIFV